MKKTILILILIFFNIIAFGQKIAYVSSDYILNKIPEYKSAIEQINQLSIKWEEEINYMYNKISDMDEEYQTKQFLMSKEERKTKEKEIGNKIKEVKMLEQKRYGNDGDLFTKREELIQPIQDRVFNAIDDFSEQNRYDVIFNKDGDLILLYANDRLDKSDEILKILGY